MFRRGTYINCKPSVKTLCQIIKLSVNVIIYFGANLQLSVNVFISVLCNLCKSTGPKDQCAEMYCQ